MSANFCSNCGSPVAVGATFCGRCGARVTPGAAPPPVAAPSPPPTPAPYAPPPSYAPPPAAPSPGPPYAAPPYPAAPYPAYDYAAAERQKQVDRTRTGVLLIAIGFILNWVPYIGLLGSLLILIGAILGILGRKAFGERHQRFVVIAILIFFFGIVAAGAVGAVFGFQFAVAISQGNLAAAATALQNLAIVIVIGAAVTGIANVLFVHELENRTGKYLLYAGYAASVIVSGVAVVYAFGQISAAVASGDLSGLQAVLNAVTGLGGLGLLNGVSSIIFAGAYFIAYSRIQRREIPPPVAPPTPAPGWPPAGPAPAPPAAPVAPPPTAPAPPEPLSPSTPPENPPPGPDDL